MTATATLRRHLAAVLPSLPAAPRPTRRPLLLARLFLSLLVAGGLAGGARGQGQAPPWELAVASSTVQSGPTGALIDAATTDAAGNVFVTGTFRGTVAFGSTLLTNVGGPGTDDVFVAKWDAVARDYTWATRGGGSGDDEAGGIAVSGRNVYVTGGVSQGTMVVIAGQPLLGLSDVDVFVAKYIDTSTGHTPATSSFANGWAIRDGGGGADMGRAIAVQGTGIFVTGGFTGGRGASVAGQALTGVGSEDLFVAKYIDTSTGSTPATSSVAPGWATSGGGPRRDGGYGIAVSGRGVFVTGTIDGTAATVAGQVLTGNRPAGDSYFVAKFIDTSTGSTPATSSFANGWAIGGSTGGNSSGNAVAVQGTSVFVTGGFEGTANPIAGQVLTSVGAYDMFVAKLLDTSTGNTPATSSVASGWATSGGGSDGDTGTGIAVRGAAVLVAGIMGDGTGTRIAGQALLSAGGPDVFVAKYADTSTGPTGSSFSNGWATSGGGAGFDIASAIAINGQQVYVVGRVNSPATFGSITLSTNSNTFVTVLARLTDPALPLATAAATARLTLSPNPARDVATVCGAAPGTVLEVLDALDRRCATGTADAAGTARLALGGLAPGMYVVRGGGQVARLAVE